LNWKRSRFLDKLFAAHFRFRFDSYRQCLCFSVEALTRETQGTKTGGERDRERGITAGERGVKREGGRSREGAARPPPKISPLSTQDWCEGRVYEWKKNQGKSSPKEWSSPRCSQAPLDLRMGLNNMLQ
jgi:hypothetical protein